MKTTQKFFSAGATTLVLVGLLAACSPSTSDATSPAAPIVTSSATAPAGAATPGESQAGAPVAAPAAGDVVKTMDQQSAAEKAGLKVYPLSQGGIVFDPAQPLPDAIKADIAAPVAETIASQGGQSNSSVWSSADRAAANASSETGHKVIVAFSAMGGLSAENPGIQQLWLISDGGLQTGIGRTAKSTSRDTTVAAVQAFIAAQPDAANWDIIVAS